MITLPDSDYVIRHSAQTILWQAGELMDGDDYRLDSEGNPQMWDGLYGDEDVHPTTAVKILRDVYGFIASVAPDNIVDYLTRHDWDSFIHDYWLTRNGHGAGFWDRGDGELGDVLSELARNEGEYSVFDDHVAGYVGWFYE